MIDRETILPLLAGLVVAALLHLTLVPSAMQWSEADLPWWRRLALPRVAAPDPVLEKPPTPLGLDDGAPLAVAWVPYEHYQALRAPRGSVEQPAVQQDVEPTPAAPVVPQPTEPAPQPVPQPLLPADPAPPDPHLVAPVPVEGVGDIAVRPVLPATPAQGDRGAQPVEAPAAQPDPPAVTNPTSAPRAPRDADPVLLTDRAIDVTPGGVITVAGIEIRTTRPRFSLTALFTAAPTNPTVSLTFNPDGTVTEALVTRGTGYADLDGPILTALYKWKATGEKLRELNRPFTVELRILLTRE